MVRRSVRLVGWQRQPVGDLAAPGNWCVACTWQHGGSAVANTWARARVVQIVHHCVYTYML